MALHSRPQPLPNCRQANPYHYEWKGLVVSLRDEVRFLVNIAFDQDALDASLFGEGLRERF